MPFSQQETGRHIDSIFYIIEISSSSPRSIHNEHQEAKVLLFFTRRLTRVVQVDIGRARLHRSIPEMERSINIISIFVFCGLQAWRSAQVYELVKTIGWVQQHHTQIDPPHFSLARLMELSIKQPIHHQPAFCQRLHQHLKKTLVECSVENANCVQFNYNKCYLIFPSIWKRDFNQQWRAQCNWSNTREPFLHFTGQVKPCPHFSSNLSVDLCTMILSYVNFTPPLSPLAICWQNSMINWHWASFAKVLIENYPPCS